MKTVKILLQNKLLLHTLLAPTLLMILMAKEKVCEVKSGVSTQDAHQSATGNLDNKHEDIQISTGSDSQNYVRPDNCDRVELGDDLYSNLPHEDSLDCLAMIGCSSINQDTTSSLCTVLIPDSDNGHGCPDPLNGEYWKSELCNTLDPCEDPLESIHPDRLDPSESFLPDTTLPDSLGSIPPNACTFNFAGPYRRIFQVCLFLMPLFWLSLRSRAQPSRAQPSKMVVAGVGTNTSFLCEHPSLVSVEWIINDTSLDNLRLGDAIIPTINIDGGFSTLAFVNVQSGLNGTRGQCKMNTTSGDVVKRNFTLLLQGKLHAVGDLEIFTATDTVFLNWTAPFTLDISFVHPDIKYCVDVVSSTRLHSECEITETEFTYRISLEIICDELNITVTPVNRVGNGTENSALYSPFASRSGSRIQQIIIRRDLILLQLSEPVCITELTLVDEDSERNVTLGEYVLSVERSRISFNAELLTPNRHYKVLGGQIVSGDNQSISTHDIQNLLVFPSEAGIILSLNFVENSDAVGALIAFIFVNEDGLINFSKSSLRVVNKSDVSNGQRLHLDIEHAGQYVVNAYDVENFGRINDGTGFVAAGCELTIKDSQARASPPLQDSDCLLNTSGRLITAYCSYTHFQVVVLNKIHTKSIHVITSKDPGIPITFQVLENGEYWMTVLRIHGESGILFEEGFSLVAVINDTLTDSSTASVELSSSPPDSTTKIAILMVIGAILAIGMVAVLVLLVVLWMRYKKKMRVSLHINSATAMVKVSTTLASVITAITTALLATLIFVLLIIALYKYHPKFTRKELALAKGEGLAGKPALTIEKLAERGVVASEPV